jgi:phosphoenolpyruvate---glycerone phosphotransferase subunit DhaL
MMQVEAITADALGVILEGVASDMKQHVEELRELDAVLGDGDLGITVDMAADAMLQAVAAGKADDAGRLMSRCGASIRRASPSTFGTLLGSAFVEAGRVVEGKPSVTIADLGSMGVGAVAGVRKWGKAEVGDKTMLDALAPAVEAFNAELPRSGSGEGEPDLEHALQAAVEAARSGMEATTAMRAKHGRTSWHQEKGVGVRDAGAAAMCYLIRAFARRTLDYCRAEAGASDGPRG